MFSIVRSRENQGAFHPYSVEEDGKYKTAAPVLLDSTFIAIETNPDSWETSDETDELFRSAANTQACRAAGTFT